MGLVLGRTVEIQVYNNTQKFTLRNPRTYFDCGLCHKPPHPFVSPGSTDTIFFPGSFPFEGVVGILVYEAESFSLAIHFSNPINYMNLPMRLGLELSLSKDHDNLETTYARMARGQSCSSSATKGKDVILTKSHGTIEVSNGPVKVVASMSNTKNAVLKVVVEEEGASGRKP